MSLLVELGGLHFEEVASVWWIAGLGGPGLRVSEGAQMGGMVAALSRSFLDALEGGWEIRIESAC